MKAASHGPLVVIASVFWTSTRVNLIDRPLWRQAYHTRFFTLSPTESWTWW